MSDVLPAQPSAFQSALDLRLAQRSRSRPEEVSPRRWAYRKAAAVLTSFHLPNLNPVPGATGEAAERNPMTLLPDVVPSPGGRDRQLHTLTAEVRRASLAQLGSRAAMIAALEANPLRVHDEFQQFFERWLAGTQPPLEEQDYRQLTWSTDIVSWLRETLPDLPGERDLQQALARRSVFGLFEHLADDTFVGRQRELELLREFVSVLPAKTVTTALARQFRLWLGLRPRTPLVIEGSGGVGKSALVGRFLLDHATATPELRYPFAYLAFDNQALRIDEPATIIGEIASQLRRSFPDNMAVFDEFGRHAETYTTERRKLSERGGRIRLRGERLTALEQAETALVVQLARLVGGISRRRLKDGSIAEAPFLLVFDTFEEVQYRQRESLIGFERFLGLLYRELPNARVVICGRTPVYQFQVNGKEPARLTVEDLEVADREELLRRLGVTDPETVEGIARQVGGNPLNLRLAARLLQSEQATGGRIAGLRTTTWGWFAVSQELIRGQLYSRILNHIHDEEVRKLAHPGLVVRRVTPEIVLEVLAGPCGLNVPDITRAKELCDALAREHTLIVREPDGALRYRDEIRTPALALLTADRPQEVRSIHKAAVAWYRQRTGTLDRAEELYHRLALDQEPQELGSRWRPEVATFLAGSLDELPARARTWLASQIGVELSPEVRARADLEIWERLVGRKALEALRYLAAESALRFLGERAERTAESPLFALEAKALIQVHRYDAARDLLGRGIKALEQGTNRGRLVELLWLDAHVAELQARIAEADDSLARAERVASVVRDRLCLLQVVVQRAVLRHEHPGVALGDSVGLRDRVSGILATLAVGDLDREVSLVRAAAAVVGVAYRDSFVRVVKAVGFPELPDAERHVLAQALEQAAGSPDPAPAEDHSRARSAAGDLRAGRVAVNVLTELLDTAFYGAVAPTIAARLQEDLQSMSAANLPGLDEYREPWESEEAAPEAMA